MRASIRRILWGFARTPISGPFQSPTPRTSSSAVLLDIPSSDGTGQACHPSVAFDADGIGGFRYWMANSPYANNAHKLENPEIFSSYDGLFWQVPPGLSNPLVPAPPGDDRHYHSDPSLLIHDKKLWLYFRTSDEEARPRRDWLSLMVSDDGRSWSKPHQVVESRRGYLLSPSVRVVDGQFRMWTVDPDHTITRLTVMQRKSRDGLSWSAPAAAEVVGPNSLLEPWHIEVIEVGGRLFMVLSARETGRPGSQRWHVAVEDGSRWHVLDREIEGVCLFEAGKPYKPSLLAPTEEWPAGRLYTSSKGADGAWYTALRPGPFPCD